MPGSAADLHRDPARGRVVVVALCGAGDRPIPSLGGRTPLEVAATPELDRVAAAGASTLLEVISADVPPESDSGAMSLLGYDPRRYYTGRGPLEALGMGYWDPQGSTVAFRINFACWEPSTGRLDRRTARDLTDAELAVLVDEIRAGVRLDPDVRVDLTGFGRHRGILSLASRERPLSGRVTNTDPGFDVRGGFGVPVSHPGREPRRCLPAANDAAARDTADLVNRFVAESARVLQDSAVNRERVADGRLPANLLLVRDAGHTLPELPSFADRTGRTLAMYGQIPAERGLAQLIGARFVTSGPGQGTLSGYYRELAAALLADPAEVVFVHVKGPDEPGHDGRPDDKVAALEAIDAGLVGPLRAGLDATDTLVVTCDHATPCELGIHAADRVPTAATGPGIVRDTTSAFNEPACATGGLDVAHASLLLERLGRAASAVAR